MSEKNYLTINKNPFNNNGPSNKLEQSDIGL